MLYYVALWLLLAIGVAQGGAGTAQTAPVSPAVRVVTDGESRAKPEDCRGTVVGAGVNEPDAFLGWGGFVGWESPIRLKDGTWLVGFNAGYWHASLPTPLRIPAGELEEIRKLGFPDVEAPRGGRAMIVRSTDQGKTWSKPYTMIDTPADDRHPAFIQLKDGTLIASLFTYPGSGDSRRDPTLAYHVVVIRSFDGGRTWEQEPRRLPSPFVAEESDGPIVRLRDGSVLLTVDGIPQESGPSQAAFFSTRDRGETWKLLGVVKADHNLDEATAVQLPNRRLVMMARPEGDIAWSDDGGHTWTKPLTFGMRMYAPSLYVLKDGTLLCLHGSYGPGAGGLRAIFSTDGGQTWIAPAKDHGFLVDYSYGYGKGMLLPDGSLYITYISTGGHRTQDAKANAIWCIRLMVRKDHTGIDLLPAPNHVTR